MGSLKDRLHGGRKRDRRSQIKAIWVENEVGEESEKSQKVIQESRDEESKAALVAKERT